MKLGPVTKLDKRNTAASTKFEDDVMNCDVIVIFTMYGQFGAIWKLDSKLRFSLTVTFHLTKIKNRTKKSLTQLSYYCID